MMVPQKLIGRIESKINLAGNNWMVRLRFKELPNFLPGQYLSLKVTEVGMRRSYSVADLVSKQSVDILVDVSPMGVGSRFILETPVGGEVEVLGFLGRFTIEHTMPSMAKEILFLATGTGVAPLRPMIENLLYKKHFSGPVRLIWGMRNEKDLYWLREFEKIKQDFKNFSFDLVISKPTEGWLGKTGRVGKMLSEINGNWSKTAAYLCGSTEMISEIEKMLLDKGVPDEQIFYEKYF